MIALLLSVALVFAFFAIDYVVRLRRRLLLAERRADQLRASLLSVSEKLELLTAHDHAVAIGHQKRAALIVYIGQCADDKSEGFLFVDATAPNADRDVRHLSKAYRSIMQQWRAER